MAIPVDSSQNAATPLPVRKLSAAEVCEMSLQKIGDFPTNDENADPDSMERALQWFDVIVAEVTGNRRCYWLTPETVTFEWPDGEASVVLADQMGSGYPPLGILFPIRAWDVDRTTGTRCGGIELCRRDKFEAQLTPLTSGLPNLLYIDRLVENQKAYISPIPNSSSQRNIALEFQTYTRSVLGEQGGDQAGDISTGFDQTWNLFLITRLSAELGDGPVKRLETQTIRDWRALSEGLLSSLLTYQNREKNNRPVVTRRYGG
jgi:hypothetical protein